jgi:regulator of CtrA degradation
MAMTEQPAVFTRTYDETFDMIVEARNYMRHMLPRERRQGEDGDAGLRFSCEALRVTSRLTQVMAWLMLQRAVVDGEMTQAEALCEQNRLSGQNVCLSGEEYFPMMPAGLCSLLQRSQRLYERVSRLEAMALSRLPSVLEMGQVGTIH